MITMMRLTRREKIFFILCLCAVFCYTGLNFVIKPLRQKTLLLKVRIAKKERIFKKNLRILNIAREVENEYRKYSEILKQKMSDEEEMAFILSEIESVASESGMRVNDMKPKKVRKIDFFNQFSVSLAIEGNLGAVMDFLYKLQNAPHSFNMDEVRFEKRSRRTSKIKCRLILSRTLIS